MQLRWPHFATVRGGPSVRGGRRRGSRRRNGGVGVWSLSVVCVAMAAPGVARASETRVVSRTMGEGYMIKVPGADGPVLRRRRLVQYVNLDVQELLPPKDPREFRRDPGDGQLSIVTSLRLRHDFGDYRSGATGDGRALVQTLDGRQVDLLYAYLQGRKLGGWVDFRAGRQFEMSGLDFYAFDGGWVRAETPAHFAVEAFSGLMVRGSDVLGYPTFELDGTWGTRTEEALSPVAGAALTTARLKWIDARVAYRRTFSPDRGNAGLDDPALGNFQSGIDQELISASAAVHFADGKVHPHGAARFNLGTARLDDVAVGVDWQITEIHRLRANYLRTVPAFDLDSIFNVFNLTPFEDARLGYEVAVGPSWTLAARGQMRVFRSAETSAGFEPSSSVTLGGGGGVGAVFRSSRFMMRADAYGLGGEGGRQVGASLDTRTWVLWQRLGIDNRIYAFAFDEDEASGPAGRAGWSVALQTGGNVRLWKNVHLNLVAEPMLSNVWPVHFRALAIFSADWSFRAGLR